LKIEQRGQSVSVTRITLIRQGQANVGLNPSASEGDRLAMILAEGVMYLTEDIVKPLLNAPTDHWTYDVRCDDPSG
jgi:hypothetical protein